MFGYWVFKQIFSNLSFYTKKLILQRIFLVDNIMVYDIFELDDERVCFRFFDGEVFYQFIFLFKEVTHSKMVLLEEDFQIRKSQIFVKNYVLGDGENLESLEILVRILLATKEKEVYLLIRHLL